MRDDLEYPWICQCSDELHSCGYVEDTFACKIRHIQINTGDAKAAGTGSKVSRWDRARDLHENHFNQGI
jgi:hypothetical protein